MDLRHLPNIISACRVIFIYPVVNALLEEDFNAALIWFTVAGLSDGVDGFLARHYGWQSRLGSYLDPVADKLLLVSSYIVLARLTLVPEWLTVMVVIRDVVIFSGAVACYFLLEPFDGQPSRVSKGNTFCQLLLVFLILIGRQQIVIPPEIIRDTTFVVALTTATSGLLYVVSWGRRFQTERRKKQRSPN